MDYTTHIVDTFTAIIYVGFKDRDKIVQPHNTEFNYISIKEICQKYCDDVGLCVTITPIDYIYTKGNEPGAAVGLINYPRFPSDPNTIRNHAITLAERLMVAYNQYKVSVVFPDTTVMLSCEAE